jgi:hypothetical protein
VPEAERNNRTIGERIRTTYHNLPYKAIPRIMLKYLAMVSTQQLNLFPAKGGVSAYLSPHTLMTGRNLNYDKQCQVPFGAYIQANQENDPTNTLAPRTIDAIYLRPMNNLQGGHEIMNLRTGLMITQNTIHERPLADLVIRAVETMATEQGIKTLKLTGRNKTHLFPANWIAGVDYEDEYEENKNENNEENDETYTEQTPDYNTDVEMDDPNKYNTIDQDEIDDILAEPGNNETNPNAREIPQEREQQHETEQENTVTDDEDEDTVATASTRPTRERREPDRLTFLQHKNNHVTFKDEEWQRLEQCHNLLAQAHPNPEQDMTYEPAMAMVFA